MEKIAFKVWKFGIFSFPTIFCEGIQAKTNELGSENDMREAKLANLNGRPLKDLNL